LTDELALIERVRSFIEFGRDKFDCLDTEHPPIERPLGYIRKGEYWILAATWREVLFCGDEVKAVRAAQAMRGRGFLRLQEHAANEDHTLQCTVRIRSAVERAYVIKKTFLDTAPLDREGGFFKNSGIKRHLLPIQNGSRPVDITALYASDQDPPMSALAEQGARLAYAHGIALLSSCPDPTDRNYAQILRSQNAYGLGFINVKFKADEAVFKSLNEKEEREQLQSLINELREANARHRADEMRWRLQAPQIDPVSDK
jgi:hypothetical protein